MRDLFYSTKEKILFQVVGYSGVDIVQNVSEIIRFFNKDIEEFVKITGVKANSIMTKEILKSSRYQGCRVYWTLEQIEKIPKEAFKLDEKWDIWQWLTN